MPHASLYHWFGAITLSLAACGPGGGDDDAGSGSGGSDDGATEPTGGFDGVIVTREDMFIPAAGEPVVEPLDPLDGEAMTILVGDQTFMSELDGAGQRSFAGVPEAPYLLRVDYPSVLPGAPPVQRFTATALRVLDFGASVSGRPDVAFGDATLVLDVDGMQPLTVFDSFELYSYGADAWALISTFDGEGAPLEGDAALSGWALPWTDAIVLTNRAGVPLIDPGKGDAPRLAHLAGTKLVPGLPDLQDPWSYATVSRVVESAALTMPPMTAGGTAQATGSFEPVAMKSVALDLRLGAFFAELTKFAASSSADCSVSIYIEPGVEAPVIGITPSLTSLNVPFDVPIDLTCLPDELGECNLDVCPDGCEDVRAPVAPADRVVELSYGNPYGVGTESLSVVCNAYLTVSHPEADTEELLTVNMFVNRRLADVSGPLVPTLTAPGDLRVNGEPAPASAVTTVGLTPTISFTAPALGAPDDYTITVRTLEDVVDAGGEILSSRRTVATLRTADTTLQIPAGILEEGAYYYFQVNAGVGSELGSPRRAYTHATAGARTATGIVTP